MITLTPSRRALLIPLGSVSFLHSKLIHGAYGNRGSVRRIAVAQHYHAA